MFPAPTLVSVEVPEKIADELPDASPAPRVTGAPALTARTPPPLGEGTGAPFCKITVAPTAILREDPAGSAFGPFRMSVPARTVVAPE